MYQTNPHLIIIFLNRKSKKIKFFQNEKIITLNNIKIQA